MKTNNRLIVKNTAFLYVRLLITVFITIFTSRFVLQTLGVEDFGVYNVVGGVVVMFGFLNSGMVQASQRFMSYELGRGNKAVLNDLFSTTLFIHILIAAIVCLLVEIVGVYYINSNHFVINPERIYAANWVLQCSLLSFVLMIICVPFNACVISHERMDVYAIISIIDSILKLGIVFIVQVLPYDKLITYSLLLGSVSLTNIILYYVLCKKMFPECSFKIHYNKDFFKRILGFASWSFIGNIGFSFRGQGVNMVINAFFGTAVNASRGLAYQVSSQVSAFVSNFQMAFVPQITKRYAANEITSMLDLVFKGSKYSLYLLSFIAIPVIVDAPYILNLWLGEGHVPQYTVEFLRLSFVVSLIDGASFPLGKAIDATGKIKWFQIILAIIMLLDIPCSYLFLSFGVEPYMVMLVAVFISIVGLFTRLLFVKNRFSQVSISEYMFSIFLRAVTVCIFTYLLAQYIMDHFIPNDFLGLVAITIITCCIDAIFIYIIGLDMKERKLINRKIGSLLRVVRNKVTYYYLKRHPKGYIQTSYQYELIGDGKKDTFFGYYDINPFNPNSDEFVFLRLREDNRADICIKHLNTGEEKVLTHTNAWNWQQGSRLRWLPNDSRSIVFNDCENDTYMARIINIDTGEEHVISRALYDISPDGKYGISVDFGRLGVKRPGYGYTNYKYVAPDNLLAESIWLVDMFNNKNEILLTYADIIKSANISDERVPNLYINHLSFSPSGNKLMFFLCDGSTRRTEAYMFVYDFLTKELYPLEVHDKVSHYVWSDDNTILATVYNDNMECNYISYTLTNERKFIMKDILQKDGHPIIFNDNEYITDTYPDRSNFQHLFVFNVDKQETRLIADVYSTPHRKGEFRTDLHPRYHKKSGMLCIDSNSREKRQIVIFKNI